MTNKLTAHSLVRIGAALLASGLSLLPIGVLAETTKNPLPVETYKDLPGVKAPGQADPDYACRTATDFHDRWPPGPSARDGMPYLVYRCQSNGVTYQGTGTPISPHWFPGINPTDLNPGNPGKP